MADSVWIRTQLLTMAAAFREELVRTVTLVTLFLFDTFAVQTSESGFAEAALRTLGSTMFAALTRLATVTAAFRIEFMLAMAFIAHVVLDALPVNSDKARFAEATLLTARVAWFSRHRACLQATISTIRLNLVFARTFIATVLGHAFSVDPNESSLAKAALLTLVRTVLLVSVALFVAFLSACFVDLTISALLVALPVRNTLSANPYKALPAEATLLTRL